MSDKKKDLRPRRGGKPQRKVKQAIEAKPAFRDESLAPAVEHELLRALVRRELPEATARDVHRFIHSFKSWSDAYCEALVQNSRGERG
jgi:hypothetical protein